MKMENKPCPFCGIKQGNRFGHLALCPVTDWNTRPIEDALRKEGEDRDKCIYYQGLQIESLKSQLRATELVWSKEIPTTFDTHVQKCGKNEMRIWEPGDSTCEDCIFLTIPEPKEPSC